MKIYLTRHGETEWNLEGRIQSLGDSSLTINGINSSKELSIKLRDVEFARIYSSTLGRAVNTAEIIKDNRKIEVVKVQGLREINLERWRGKYYNDFKNKDLELYEYLYNKPHKYEPEEDETYMQFYIRVKETVEDILFNNNNGNILIVAHLHTLRAILAYLKRIDIKNIAKEFPTINNNEVIIVDYKDKY